ncbi:hypothetical protein INT43_000367 [Umbelopsis isabellina]|uniref:Nucleolar protein 16 n=1 Tax=Mortierella isabellina TaxID=91625 RepID=A0A8H7Q204_MORIS|nr:hypothetical protein INT43_000367 [Umbelopsis isabellina]
MANPRQRKANRSGNRNTRRTANKHKKRVVITGNPIIKANWDKKKTLKQNYENLGLLTTLNGSTGGNEKLNPLKPEEGTEDGTELKELTEEEIEKLKKTLKPGEGVIQRDDDGNVVRVIVGEQKTHDEILEEAAQPVVAKTDVVRALEEQAANALKIEKFQSGFEESWIGELIAKHGDDYEAMFWDKQLNQYQQTASQLKKKCQKFLKAHSKQ